MVFEPMYSSRLLPRRGHHKRGSLRKDGVEMLPGGELLHLVGALFSSQIQEHFCERSSEHFDKQQRTVSGGVW